MGENILKVKNAIYQIIEYDNTCGICAVEVATSVGVHTMIYDLAVPSERFSAIVLRGYAKENSEPWKKGTEIKVILDENNELAEICPPHMSRR
jgi:hypothetical protein